MPSALLVALNKSVKKDFLVQLLSHWGVTSLPDKKEELVQKFKEYNQSKGVRSDVIRIVLFYHNKSIFVLRSAPVSKEESDALGEQTVEGLAKISNKLGSAAENWKKYTFSDSKQLKKDSLARIHAESICNPFTTETAFKWELKEDFEMDFPSQEELLDYKCDILDEEEKFTPASVAKLEAKTNNLSISDYKNRIKISTFDPEKESVTSWIDNNVYSLELDGIRDEPKIVARLMSGLPDPLLFAVRQDMQNTFPGGKRNGEDIKITDFADLLTVHANQTAVDLQRSLDKLQISAGSNLRESYFKLLAILTALYPKTTDEEDKKKLVTQYFRQKLPSNIRNSAIITTSEAQGLDLVKLAQRLMDANKSESISSNKMGVGHGRGGRGRGRGRGGSYSSRFKQNGGRNNGFRSQGGRSKGPGNYKNNGKTGYKDQKRETFCNFCGLKGHWERDCREYSKAKQARREELEKKRQ